MKRFVSFIMTISLLFTSVFASDIGEATSEDELVTKLFEKYLDNEESITREECLTVIMRTIGLTDYGSTGILNVDFDEPIFSDVFSNGFVLTAGFHQIVARPFDEKMFTYCFYPDEPAKIIDCLTFMVSCLINSTVTDDSANVISNLAEGKGLISDDDDFYNNTDELLTKESFAIFMKRFLNCPVYYYFTERPNAWQYLSRGYKDNATYYDIFCDQQAEISFPEYNALDLNSADIQRIDVEYTAGSRSEISTIAELYQLDGFVYSTEGFSEIEYITHYLKSLDITDDGEVVHIADGTCLDCTITKTDGTKEHIGFMGPVRLYRTDNLDNVDNQYAVNNINQYRQLLEFVCGLNSGKIAFDMPATFGTSDWAKADVDTAIENLIVPKWNQINYVDKINRVEVCQMVNQLLIARGFTDEVKLYKVFDDTTDTSVKSLFDKDIINGKNEKEFYPYDYITREEFAKILSNTYTVLTGFNILTTDELDYADRDDVSYWAKRYVSGAKRYGLMIGNDNNEFKPKDNITKEEVIVTLLRLFKITDMP